MSLGDFTEKERLRFRKLLEVAYSTTFAGEREAALGAAERLAAAHGMSLREAAGMGDEKRPRAAPNARAAYRADHGAAAPEDIGRWWTRRPPPHTPHGYRSDADALAVEKRRHDQAMEDAIQRGLDAEERRAAQKAALRQSNYKRPSKRGNWRARPEFVRVLLAETCMSAKDIASVAGVTIYDVFREKLLMRRAAAAATP